jgi:hypothetical protein
MEYVYELIWFSLWPAVIIVSYKITYANVKKYEFKDEEVI